MGETLLFEIPAAANFVVSTFFIVEMADDGTEGLVYGLLTTIGNLGSPFGRAVANQIFANFDGISEGSNYVEDLAEFRQTVANSFTLSYTFAFASMAFIWFLPDQKAETQHRKATWSRRPAFAYVTLLTVAFALVYATTLNVLVMFPATMCLKIVGGSGCNDE